MSEQRPRSLLQNSVVEKWLCKIGVKLKVTLFQMIINGNNGNNGNKKKASYFNALELRATVYNYAFTENKIIALLSL